MFRVVSPPIIKSSKTVHTASGASVPGLLAATASVVELFQLNHAASKPGTDAPDAVCTVFELLMMGAETTRNMQSIDSNKEYCITLHLVGCT
jgi:hypothetical protein